MKRFASLCLSVILLTSCSFNRTLQVYGFSFFDTFDTVVQVTGYAYSQEEFDEYVDYAWERFRYFHKLFDKYYTYDDINNIKSINDNAGKSPVEVAPEIIDLLLMAKEWQKATDGAFDIAYGDVMNVWYEYRKIYEHSAQEMLPPMEKLVEASQYADINKLIINKENSTVYISDENMSIDVGAIAKGYVTQIVANELYSMGFENFSLSAGGNTKLFGAPPKENGWILNIRDPLKEEGHIQSILCTNTTVVTSGDYMRYYIVEGKKIHHIIDTNTLMPADNFSSVTVIAQDSTLADVASTALFVMDLDTGLEFAREYEIDAMWVTKDGEIIYTDKMTEYLRS